MEMKIGSTDTGKDMVDAKGEEKPKQQRKQRRWVRTVLRPWTLLRRREMVDAE